MYYLLRLWTDAERSELLYESDLLSSTSLLLDETVLGDGTYWWDVLAVDVDGNASESDEVFEVRVVSTNDFPAFLAGAVTNADSGAPVNAELTLQPGNITVAATGGAYAIALEAATYTVVASAPGHEDSAPVEVVVDAGALEVLNLTLAATTATIELKLAVGWNLVSLPIVPDDGSVAGIFENDEDLPEPTVWGWSERRRQLEPRREMQPQRGYWIRSLTARTISVHGSVIPDPTVTVRRGWSLWGVSGAWRLDDAAYPGLAIQGWESGAAVDVDQQSAPFAGILRPTSAYWFFTEHTRAVQLGPQLAR
jgi:hypothetical protein